MAMKLSTGKIAFPIEFDNGDIENIYFNPSDPELGTNLIKAKDIISERIKELNLNDIDLSNDGKPIDIKALKNIQNLSEEEQTALFAKAEKATKAVSDTNQIIREELNKAFGSDISSVVFKYCSPFAIVDDNYFVLNFLETIGPEIEKCIKKSNKGLEKKMLKHIGKYKK